jgi:hypothetical protein
MDSKTIVERYGANLIGQGWLWQDDDHVLRNTPFKSIDLEFDRAALVHFWMNVYIPDGHNENETPYEVYKTWNVPLYSLFKYVTISGYRPDSNQSAVRIGCIKKDPLEDQVAELKMWLPHIKPSLPDRYSDKTVQVVSILEDTLSLHGSYQMLIDGNTYEVGMAGLYRDKDKFGSLEEAVNLIRQRYWYKKT